MAAVVNPFPDFNALNSSTYLYQASASSSNSNSTDPSLILLITWLNALPKHISKYVQGYRNLYPNSGILILRSNTWDVTVASGRSKLSRISPALSVLQSLQSSSNNRILLHFFSNGGAATTSLLLRSYRQKTGHVLPLKKVVFDSTPGRATYTLTVRAFSVALPRNNLLLYYVGGLLIRVFLALWWVMEKSTRSENIIEVVRRDLNDGTLMHRDVARLYVYGESDDMVLWRDVEEHAKEAEELGYSVTRERYVDTGHAGHLLGDEKRYWGAVQKLWES